MHFFWDTHYRAETTDVFNTKITRTLIKCQTFSFLSESIVHLHFSYLPARNSRFLVLAIYNFFSKEDGFDRRKFKIWFWGYVVVVIFFYINIFFDLVWYVLCHYHVDYKARWSVMCLWISITKAEILCVFLWLYVINWSMNSSLRNTSCWIE